MNEQSHPVASIWPIACALGTALVLVGLIASPLVIAPVGGAIAVLAGSLWVRGNTAAPRREPAAAPTPEPEPLAENEIERYSRKRLLESATLGLGGLVALGVALPAAGFAVLPSFLGPPRKAVDLGPIDDYPEGQYVVATFLSDPQSGEVSRRAAYVRNNGFVGSMPSFTILSSRCTHVGCPTQPNGPLFFQRRMAVKTSGGEVGLVPAQAAGFGCPCHGSQFDSEGNRTAGPAPRPLDRYEFSIRNGRLWLGALYSVGRVRGTGARARISAFGLRDAGQPVTGPESFLYPVSPSS